VLGVLCKGYLQGIFRVKLGYCGYGLKNPSREEAERMMIMFQANLSEQIALSVLAVTKYTILFVCAVWFFRSVKQIQSKLDAIERRLNSQ
jgi:hypothetical protein